MTQKRVKIIVLSDAPLKTQSTLFELLQAIWIFSKFISCPVLKLQQTLCLGRISIAFLIHSLGRKSISNFNTLFQYHLVRKRNFVKRILTEICKYSKISSIWRKFHQTDDTSYHNNELNNLTQKFILCSFHEKKAFLWIIRQKRAKIWKLKICYSPF